MFVMFEHGARLLLARTDRAVVIHFDHALGLQLGDDLLGLLILHHHLVVLGQLLLGGRQLLHFRLEVGFSVCLCELVLSDLFLRSSPFAGQLEHVGRHAFLHC